MLLFGLVVVFLALALHPFTTFLLSLRLLARLRPAAPPAPPSHGAGHPLSVSVLMCAYNEAAVIADKARNLLTLQQCASGEVELLVYVDGSSDDTAQQLRPFADAITVVSNPERRGKSHGMRHLAGLARGDILMFTDANVMIDRDAVGALRRHFANPHVGCVCGHLVYGNADASSTSAVNSAYWRLEEETKRLESELGAVMGADGSLFAVRRQLHPSVPDDIIDDFFVSLSILCDGHRVVRAPDMLAYENSVVDSGEEFRRKVRIACQAFNVHRLLWPRLRRLPVLQLYCYVSHKLLRWFVAPNLLIAGGLLLVGLSQLLSAWLVLGAVVALTTAWFGALAAGVRPVRRLWEIWLAFYATALGVLRSLRGDRFQTWAPAQSIRALRPGQSVANSQHDSLRQERR